MPDRLPQADNAAPAELAAAVNDDVEIDKADDLNSSSDSQDVSDGDSDTDTSGFNKRFMRVRRAVSAVERLLLHGSREYSRGELAHRRGIPEKLSKIYWRSMGFTNVDDDVAVFTDEDADAIAELAELVADGTVTERTFANLTRGLGFHMGRLAMWETEALVEEYKREGMPDAEARLRMLDAMPDMIDLMEAQALYVFRRQLAAYTARAGAEILQAGEGDNDDAMPLLRAVGFADLVSFTRLAQSLSGHELADVIGDFESTCRDIVSIGGGRVVKTVGDEIMFLADAPEDGVQIALSIAEALTADDDMPDVRVGLSWGSMFSRFGDVFGPTVNLAARLEGIAMPGTVLIDQAAATAVEEALPGAFVLERLGERELQGIGAVHPYLVRRGASRGIDLDA
ncbi:adenylate/guanylate cyclase domain-containing protein [Devriesea agamarum]|uniref:adenylate/guanylate cyclase domain-containing protein n=1 Tax=Devriesea agamarum TaxID=472569 RepID=UPI00071DEBEF|nr:adenylate/guanylate cyclase domain-containing protein [Devriesea agamarum]